MISLDEVEQSILEIEQKDTCFANCEKLAWLYVVRDNLRRYANGVEAADVVQVTASSEFLQTINGKNPATIWPVLDELMQAVQVLRPNLYTATIEKLKR